MPHATGPSYKHITVTPLAPTFAAEVSGVDFSKPVPDEVFQEIVAAITIHAVLVFRGAHLNDDTHVSFSRLFGALDDVKPYLTLGRENRFAYDEIFDVSNLEDDGSLVQVDCKRDHTSRGNTLFHVDSSFNPRRAGFSLLRAHELPPEGTGGETEFADTRTAWEELPEEMKRKLVEARYVGAHSLWHSRMKAVPGSKFFEGIDPMDYPFGRHMIVQRHERSGRGNLYVANHLHHLERVDGSWVEEEEGRGIIEELLKFATKERYVVRVEWKEVGDLVIWDNTAVMHRSAGGSFMGKYKRDMRRTTVHDDSSVCWGLNERTEKRMGLP